MQKYAPSSYTIRLNTQSSFWSDVQWAVRQAIQKGRLYGEKRLRTPNIETWRLKRRREILLESESISLCKVTEVGTYRLIRGVQMNFN